MRKKLFKIKKGIFQKLIVSYFVFSVLVIISFVACLLFEALIISEGDTDALFPYGIIDDEGDITNLTGITKLGGWVEKLDENYEVVQVYGEKKTPQMKYTQEEIYELICMSWTKEDDKEYMGFINPSGDGKHYFLCLYDSGVMKFQATLILNGGQNDEAKKWSDMGTLIFLCLFVVNCVMMSLYLRRKIKKPLDELVSGMERVRAGEQSVVLEFKTEAEFEQIRNAFNIMIQQLERERREKADIVRKKNQLLLELSHDIKTPTATIKSYANALEAGLVPEDKIQDYYRTIDLKADRITSLSEDMFTLLKMENADYRLQLVKTDLGELLRKICTEYYEELVEAGFAFDVDIPEKICMGTVDIRLFTRVIGNLLLNAKRYNLTGRVIRLSMKDAGEFWQIDVLDDGEAVAEGLIEHLFDAFVRGDKARKSDGGTGLGLAIARVIMERHQGSIEYLRIGNENCFRVQLQHDINV